MSRWLDWANLYHARYITAFRLVVHFVTLMPSMWPETSNVCSCCSIFTGDIRIQYRIKRVDGRENKNGQRRSARLHVCEPNVSRNLNQVSRRRYESPATSWVFHPMK